MSVFTLHKERVFWVIVILAVSLGMVGVALASANRAGQEITNAQSAGSQFLPSAYPDQYLQPSSVKPSANAPEPGVIDKQSEQMRLQAMAASRASAPDNFYRVEFWNSPSSLTWIWGGADPNQPITITTSSGDTLYGWADENGEYTTDHGVYLYPGDVITATDASGSPPVVIMFPEMQANSDSVTDQVYGKIGYANWTVEIYPEWGDPMTTTLTDGDGNFSAQFAEIFPPGRGYIRFMNNLQPENVDAIFHHVFNNLQPVFNVNYAHDWIDGNYDPGYQLWITVTNELGDIRATGQGMTGDPGWNGETGFGTYTNFFTWDGMTPDIQVWDKVYLRIDNGRTAEVQLGEISGSLDTGIDIFEGTLNVPWLTDPVWVDCGVWTNDGPGMGMEVDPNGGAITCDFHGQYDILPGMDVGVGYWIDGYHIMNVFRDPAPDLGMWIEDVGELGSGSNYSLRVHYNNDGWAAATGVTISETLNGLEYISDTSGFDHTGTGVPGDPIIWDVGDLPYNHYGDSSFMLFVKVLSPAGEVAFTNAEIDTSMVYYQYDLNRMHAYWERMVGESNSDVNIGINAWTWDPVPGGNYVYAVNVCSQDSTSSPEFVISDTLPISTTLVNWWGQYPGYEEISRSDHHLTVSRPTLPAYWCSEVYIEVQLSPDAYPGMPLETIAEVTMVGDPTPEDNITWAYHNVGVPYNNLWLRPNWTINGQLVPGGEFGFELWYGNDANVPMPGSLLTVSLPAGVVFNYAYKPEWNGWIHIDPTIVTDEYLVFDLGDYPNGFSQIIGIRVKVKDSTLPGTALTFESRIAGDLPEVRYDDNELVYSYTVNPKGPNMQIDTHTRWGWNYNWGDASRQLWYDLQIINLGTLNVENIVITDTYPASATLQEGNYGINCPGGASCSISASNGMITAWISRMDLGWNTSLWMNLDIPGDLNEVQGLAYTNQVVMPVDGDVDPGDNEDHVTAYSGMDVFVTKAFKEGALVPGGLITYTVDMGNMNNWPITPLDFGSHITDTIPLHTSFVRAIGYWDLQNLWNPESIDGRVIVWGWGPMWPQSSWRFDVVVQIDDDVMPGTELLNTVVASGDNPADVDLNPDNNISELLLQIPFIRTFLPLNMRTP